MDRTRDVTSGVSRLVRTPFFYYDIFMMNFFLLVLAIIFVVKSADMTIRHVSHVSGTFRLSKYIIGFIVIAVISILPETFISIASALQGIPSFGLGTLFGSNVADLTLVFAIIIFSTKHGIRVGSKVLEDNVWYPLLLLLPLILGLDGHYSRIDGAALIVAGLLFYVWIFRKNHLENLPDRSSEPRVKNILFLVLGMAGLVIGSHLTVKFGVELAFTLGLSPLLIGMLLVGIGTTMPELLFSLRALKQNNEEIAFGDILGTVISDATIVVGILALVAPFEFSKRIVYLTGSFMLIAAFILFALMRSGHRLTKKEGVLLLLFYLTFVVAENLLSMSE